jgi:hypothetical protein
MTTRYIGTKVVFAEPMTRGAYNDYRGWTIPANEDPLEAGYLVEYADGGASNHVNHVGYISWSPKDVFDRSYRAAVGLSFGMAIEALKSGLQVARVGWNGKGMFLDLFRPEGTMQVMDNGDAYPELPWIGMKTADNKFVPWLASQTDMLADDWVTV